MIVGTPKPGYHPKDRDAKALDKIRGKLWVDKSNYQWVRLEAESTGTISFGLFLARLNPGAKVVFEQTRVNDEVWLPKHMFLKGTGKLGLLVRVRHGRGYYLERLSEVSSEFEDRGGRERTRMNVGEFPKKKLSTPVTIGSRNVH